MELQNDKFYLIDVDTNAILVTGSGNLVGPFDSSDDGDDWLLDVHNINTLYNSNPFSFRNGAAIKTYFKYPFVMANLDDYDLASYEVNLPND
jgi:hypothetical protein